MKVLISDPIESSLIDLQRELKNNDVIKILTSSGQILGSTLFTESFQKNLNPVTLIPLVRLSLEYLRENRTQDISNGTIEALCKKVASLGGPKNSSPEGKSTAEDLNEYLIQLEFIQGQLQEDFSRAVARMYILLFEMKSEWKTIDIEARFIEIFGVKLERLVTIFFGIVALTQKDPLTFPGLDFKNFFENSNSEIKSKLPLIKDKLIEKASLTIDQINDSITLEKYSFKDEFELINKRSPLEDKPFIQIDDNRFLLPVPHFLINRILDYIYIVLNEVEVNLRKEQGRTDIYRTQFSSGYGNVVEEYVRKILKSINLDYDQEPSFPKQSNERGPDAVIVHERIIVEVSKLVPNQSLRLDARASNLEECYKKVIGKFSQSFNWFNKHEFKYKNIFSSNVFFIVVTAEPFPGMHYSFGRKILSDLIDEEWKKYSKKKAPKTLVLSLSEIEILCTVSLNYKKPIRSLLDEYIVYLKNEPDLSNDSFKYSLKNYLLTKYSIKKNQLPLLKTAFDKLIEQSKASFFQ